MKKKNKFEFGKLAQVLSKRTLLNIKGGNKPEDKYDLYHSGANATAACPPPFEEDKP